MTNIIKLAYWKARTPDGGLYTIQKVLIDGTHVGDGWMMLGESYNCFFNKEHFVTTKTLHEALSECRDHRRVHGA